MSQDAHGPVPATWFAPGRWATCQCGFDPKNNGLLADHWADQGFRVVDNNGQLEVRPL